MEDVSERRHGVIHQLWARALWLARHQGLVLLALLVMAIGVWGFIELAEEVMTGDSRAFDEWVIRSLRRPDNPAVPIGPHWLQTASLDITSLGGASVLALVIAIVGLFLLLEGKRHSAFLVWIAAFGGAALSAVLKHAFQRPRPSIVPHLAEVQTASFPSGHSLMSAVVYLTLGALLAQFSIQRRVRVYVFSVAVFLTGIVGLSRVYLGVHYPTDVLAGWTAGLVWALLCWMVAAWLQSRGKVEPPGEEGGRPEAQSAAQ